MNIESGPSYEAPVASFISLKFSWLPTILRPIEISRIFPGATRYSMDYNIKQLLIIVAVLKMTGTGLELQNLFSHVRL
jgi:hypothetical protein